MKLLGTPGLVHAPIHINKACIAILGIKMLKFGQFGKGSLVYMAYIV